MGKNLNGTPKNSNFLAELKKEVGEKGKKQADSLKTAETCLKLSMVGTKSAEIAEITGIPINRVQSFTKSITNVLANFDPSKLLGYNENIVSILKTMEAQMLQYMCSEEKLSKAPLNQVAYSFEVLHKARRLEEGKSTENHSNLITIQGEKYK